MINFLFKGIIRDKSRSLFPILVVFTGVVLSVLMVSWMTGAMNNFIVSNANFSTGHVKIMTRAYAENSDQSPIDLSLIGEKELLAEMEKKYPDMVWLPRIRFGGLLDVPDEKGETASQGPVLGLGVNLLMAETIEDSLLNLQKSLVRGRLPQKSGEVVISESFESIDLSYCQHVFSNGACLVRT